MLKTTLCLALIATACSVHRSHGPDAQVAPPAAQPAKPNQRPVPPKTKTDSFFQHDLVLYVADGTPCTAAQDDLAKKFTAQTGRTVAGVKCLDTSAVVISYVGETPVDAYSTFQNFSVDTAEGLDGLYKTADECKAALPAVVDTFKRNTGVEPLASYCFFELFDPTVISFVPRVDGVSPPKLRPFSNAFDGPDPGGDKDAELIKTMSDSLKASAQAAGFTDVTYFRGTGVDVAKVVLKGYAPTDPQFQVDDADRKVLDDLVYANTAECWADREHIKTALTGIGYRFLDLWCFGSGTRAQAHPLVYGGEFDFEVTAGPSTYKDLDSCYADAAHATDAYKTQTRKQVYGVTCSRQSDPLGSLPADAGVVLRIYHQKAQ